MEGLLEKVERFVDILLVAVRRDSASHATPVGIAASRFKRRYFSRSAIENRPTEPTIGGRPARRGQGRAPLRSAAMRSWVGADWHAQVRWAIIFRLSPGSASHRKRRWGQIQHAPGRFHSGAQVVKETEQAPPPLADAARLRIRAMPGQRCRFPIQHQGNPQ